MHHAYQLPLATVGRLPYIAKKNLLNARRCDMHFLPAFLRYIRPNMSHSILCEFPATKNEWVCPLKYTLGLSASGAVASAGKRCTESALDQIIEWRQSTDGTGMPELWSRYQLYPSMEGPGERVPVLHMQGDCKGRIAKLIKENFVEPGLIPDVDYPS